MSAITAIFVTYNSVGVIAPALAALAGKPEIGGIIVVDNASADGTCAVIERDFPSVTLIRNATNEGFGRGNNRALEMVATPYALLVNPDAVMEEGALAALLAAAQTYPDAAILAPRLSGEDGQLLQSYKRSVFTREKMRGRFVVPEGDVCAEFLSGAVWLLNMQLIKEVGFFDPNIFLFYEDDDLCLRARKAGYGLVLVHGAKAMHMVGGSSGAPKPASDFFKQKHMTWSRLYLEQKYRGVFAARCLAVKLWLEYMAKTGLYTALFNKVKTNRYRGRLAGLQAF